MIRLNIKRDEDERRSAIQAHQASSTLPTTKSPSSIPKSDELGHDYVINSRGRSTIKVIYGEKLEITDFSLKSRRRSAGEGEIEESGTGEKSNPNGKGRAG